MPKHFHKNSYGALRKKLNIDTKLLYGSLQKDLGAQVPADCNPKDKMTNADLYFMFSESMKEKLIGNLTEEMLRETRRRRDAGSSIRSIARDFEIDESSLRVRLKKVYGVESSERFKYFTVEQGRSLADHRKEMDQRFYGLTRKMFRKIAFSQKNGISNEFNVNSKMAGPDWTRNFSKNYNLFLSSPQKPWKDYRLQ
ncbi:hypothetical protein HHI36_021182 [Cryptolaemus montrouzieri]|uniref:Uncharacterized protein n=1 Tax=Cryptolaemus montrouzieri TaxID=559131 RepID=A0ABD2MW20_9CUCU